MDSLNLRLMAHYLLLCTGNLHIQTSTCSGIVTITSQPNLVSSTPSPIGPQQCIKPELLQQDKDHLRKALTKCRYPKWSLDRMEKRLNRSTSESLMGPTTRALQLPNLSLMKLKIRVLLSYPKHKVFVKVSKNLW